MRLKMKKLIKLIANLLLGFLLPLWAGTTIIPAHEVGIQGNKYLPLKIKTSEYEYMIDDIVGTSQAVQKYIQMPAKKPIVKSTKDLYCPNPKPEFLADNGKLKMMTLVTDYNINAGTVECYLYHVPDSSYLNQEASLSVKRFFRFNFPVVFSDEFLRDQAMSNSRQTYTPKNKFYKEGQYDEILIKATENFSFGSTKNISSLITDVFSLNHQSIDFYNTREYQKVITTDPTDEDRSNMFGSVLPALFSLVGAFDQFFDQFSFMFIFMGLAGSLGILIYQKILRDKKSNSNEEKLNNETSPWVAFAFFGLVVSIPFTVNPIESFMGDKEPIKTTLLTEFVSSAAGTVTYANNHLAKFITTSLVENALQNTGINNQTKTLKLIENEALLMKEIQNKEELLDYCQSTYVDLDRYLVSPDQKTKTFSLKKEKEDDYFTYLFETDAIITGRHSHLLDWLQLKKSTHPRISKALCVSIHDHLPVLRNNLKNISQQVRFAQNADPEQFELVNKMVTAIYTDLANTGFLSVINLPINLYMLENFLAPDQAGQEMIAKTDGEVKSEIAEGSRNQNLNYLAANIAYTMVPGGSTVREIVSDAVVIPWLNTAAGVTASILYGKAFLTQLPYYVTFFVGWLAMIVYLASLLLISIMSLIMMIFIFFPKNYNIFIQYLKYAIRVPLMSSVFLLAVPISYMMSKFISSYFYHSITKQVELSHQYLSNTNMVASAGAQLNISVMDGILTVLMSLASAFVIYWLITSSNSFISKLIDSAEPDDGGQWISDLAGKIKNRGL